MNAVTQQFILPIAPTTTQKKLPVVYPWEQTNLYNLCQQLYELAQRSGYTLSFQEFKANFGAYLETHPTFLDETYYNGETEVIPLVDLEQILHTKHTIVTEDIIVKPIPYAETSNAAGGYTAIIG